MRRNYKRDAEIVMLATSGLTLQEVADVVGVSWQRVQQIVKRSGVQRPSKKYGDPIAVARCAEQDMTIDEVVAETGMGYENVRRIVRELDLSLRHASAMSKKERQRRCAYVVETIRTLYRQLKRTPSLSEVCAVVFQRYIPPTSTTPQLCHYVCPTKERSSYKNIITSLYVEAGVERPKQGRPHVHSKQAD